MAQRSGANAFFIAGTDTGVGKTRVTVALLRALVQAGVRAVGMKPVASGLELRQGAWINDDVHLLQQFSTPIPDIRRQNSYQFRDPVSPHIAAEREGIRVDLGVIKRDFEQLCRQCELVLVEGTGGWFAPIGEDITMADIAAHLRLPVILVVGLRLGCLNHALLSARAVAAAGLPLAGWIGNMIDPGMAAMPENLAYLDAHLPAPRLALLPHNADMSQDSVAMQTAVAKLAPGGGGSGSSMHDHKPTVDH